jgi:CHAT domain-containing protein/tetratricopeptide (TPR) repeat protein
MLTLAALGIAACLATSGGPAPFTDEDGTYSVLLPGEPVPSFRDFDTPTGTARLRQFMVEAGERAYLVGCTIFPTQDLVNSREFLDETGTQMAAMLGARVVEEHEVSSEGRPGRETRLELPGDITALLRRYMSQAEGRSCMVMATMRSAAWDEDEAARFLDTFRFLRPLPPGGPVEAPTKALRAAVSEGFEARQAGHHEDALELLEQALATAEQEAGLDPSYLRTLLTLLGQEAASTGNRGRAAEVFERALSMGSQDPGTEARLKVDLASALGETPDGRAERLASEALELARRVEDHPEIRRDAARAVAAARIRAGELAEGARLLDEALAQARTVGAPRSEAAILAARAEVAERLGDLAGAESAWEEAAAKHEEADAQELADREGNWAALQSEDLAEALERRAGVLEKLARPEEAAAARERAAEIRARWELVREFPLGVRAVAAGRYGEGIEHLERVRALAERTVGVADPHLLIPGFQLALAHAKGGDPVRARALEEEMEGIVERADLDGVTRSQALRAGAMVWHAMGQIDRALDLEQRAIDVLPPEADWEQGVARLQLALALVQAGRDAEGVEEVTRSRALLGDDALPALRIQTELVLGLAALGEGERTDATQHLEAVLTGAEAEIPGQYPSMSVVLDFLLGMLHDGEPAVARRHFEQASQRGHEALGDADPVTAGADVLLGTASLGGDAPEGEDLATRRVTSGLRTLVAGAFERAASLSEDEHAQFLEGSFQPALLIALSAARRLRTSAGIAASAEWAINGKALAEEALALRSRAIASAAGEGGPAARLAAVRREMAAMAALGRITSDPDDLLARFAEALQQDFEAQDEDLSATEAVTDDAERFVKLVEEEGRLSREVLQQIGLAGGREWTTLEQVRRGLGPAEALVELARVPATITLGAEPSEWRYLAWIVGPATTAPVSLVDLGDADEIDAAVVAVRDAWSADAEPAAPALARLVSLWGKVAEHLGAADHVVLSPDGDLWLLPFGAVPAGDGGFVVERYGLRYVTTGRALAFRPAATRPRPGPPVIVADPDYGVAAPAGARGRAPTARLTNWQRLPGTADEAAAITPVLQRITGVPPLVLPGPQAREAAVKALASPAVLHLATHGFFVAAPAPAPVSQLTRGLEVSLSGAGSAADEGDAMLSPLLRSGLVLAGANEANAAKPGEEDGILMGAEVAEMNLRGTDLVVLSACDTARGEARVGQSHADLRQAFLLAGAGSVLASLWRVGDRATVELMTSFFEHLATGAAAADALQAAQIDRIRSARAQGAVPRPWGWAAFTATGRRE